MEGPISCFYIHTGKLCVTKEPKTGVVMPSLRLDDRYFPDPLNIDPKKQFLGLRTGDRVCFSFDKGKSVDLFRNGHHLKHIDFEFNELMVRCKKGMTYLRHKYSFIPMLEERELQMLLEALDKNLDCLLVRFKSL